MLLTARPNTFRSVVSLLGSMISDRFERPSRPLEPADDPDCAPVIVRIMHLNPSATSEYLAEFSRAALSRYLAHLESQGLPRGARWERPGDSSAIVVHETDF